jgi:hypothetical protein
VLFHQRSDGRSMIRVSSFSTHLSKYSGIGQREFQEFEESCGCSELIKKRILQHNLPWAVHAKDE